VSFSLYCPMQGNNWGETVYIEGQAPPPPDSDQNNASWVRVSNEYFSALGTRILQGRAFTDQDTPTSRNVAIVNQTFAKKFFKDESPLGKHFGDIDMKHAGDYEIVGVTEDTMYWEPTAKMRPMFFLPPRQWIRYDDPRFIAFEEVSHYQDTIVLRTQGNISGLESQVRRILADTNPDLAVIDFTRFSDQVAQNFSQQDMIAKLTSLFGILALILASVGLYGVTAYSVERRTNEIGVRMALGADRLKIMGLILRGAFLQIAIGLAIGIPAIILGGRTMANELFGVKPYDPGILFLTTVALSFAGFVAAIIPSQKAASIEPMQALRTE